MKKNSMRLLGFLLAAVMMVSLFGLAVFAGDTANDVNDAAGNVDAQSSEADLLIGTADELKAFASAVNAGDSFAGKVVKLTADIDLYELGEGSEPVSFTPIGKVSETPFEGTFDGQGHTIKNLYQSGWAFGYEWGSYGSLGLFGNINDATVKNLTLTGAECFVEGGDVAGITGSATGTCVFENITITDSVFATYNNGCGSIIAWSGAGNYTFKNITIASDVTLAGLWGSFDSSIGGVVGQAEPGASYDFEDVYIACRVDAYNDCTASYDYYNYRMCGMIMGRLEETTTIDGTNYPDTSKYNITCTDVTVKYGDWMNYHYCEPTPSDMNGGRGMRVEAGYAYDGLPADYDHSQCVDNHMNLIPFDQLLGGDQIGVKGLPTYDGVTVIYPTEVAQIGDVKYWTLAEAIAAANAAENGATITLLADATVGEMMTIAKDVIIEGNNNTITWADGYNGTLINVESGVGVTLNKLNIFGDNTFSFYNDTTTVEDGQNWYTRFVDVGEEDKAINANVIVNAGDLTLNRVTIAGVTIASDGDNGKTANTETGGFYLMYNDDLALIKSNGGTVALNDTRIDNNAGLILNAINAKTEINGTGITNNMGAGNKGGIIIANGGTMSIKDTSIDRNKAMARSATILGVINGAEVVFDGFSTMDNNKHIGVGSNTAGAMIVLEGASQFVMNGGSISNNIGGRAGAIASRWVGGSYGQHEDTSIVLNAGTIKGNTASNDSWNGASVFLRSPATIGEGMKIDGTIAVNAAPGALEITGGTFNGSLTVTDGLVAEITGGTFDYDPTEWVAEGYEATDNGNGTYSVTLAKLAKVEVELMPGFWGTSYITVENWADLVAALGENTNVPVKVTLLKDIKLTDEGLTIAGTAKKVIDLNGHTITGMLVNYAELIVNDETQNGKIEGGPVAIDNYGALTVNGGFFTGEYGAIYNNELESGKATVVIYGGEFTALGDWYATIENRYGVLTVNGGKIVATNRGGYAIVDTCGETTINGGEIVSADGIAVETYAGKIIINDGSFVGKVIVENQEGNVTVYGGTLVSNTPEYYYGMTNANGGVTVLYGGTYERDYATAEGTSVKIAEGHFSVDNGDGTFTVRKAVAKVGDTYFATLQDAFAACTNGETITLLVDLVYDADDVVPPHGGATGFGKYDQYNPSIIYIGGTKGATEAENQPSNVNAVLDLNGHTITNNADAYLFLFMDNCKVTIKDSKDGDGIIGNTEAPVIWVTGTDTLVTIESGKYTTVNAEGLLWSTHGGDLVIKGGEFSTSAEDASLLIIRNAQDRRNPNYFIDGKATVTIYGGTFYGFDPEKMMDDSTDPFTEFDACADGYKSIKSGNAYTVENYIEWIKQQLLLGNDVVLEKDIIVDGSMIESIPAPTNGNGKYPNYGIFNVVGDYDVTFDLNGHSITYNGHKEFQWNGKTYNSCTVAHGLFFANDGAHLTIVGDGDVIVNGVASGVYSASPDTAITIQGGNWVNNRCAECGATNLFLYASHGGELYIEGGRFEQALDSEGNSYLIVVHGGEYKNSVIDFSQTKIVVTGGTFVGMDPSKAQYIQQTADNKQVMGETVDTVPMGYRASIYGTIDGVDVYDVVELKATVEAGFTYFFPGVENVDNVQELANYYFLMQNAMGWILGYDYEPVLTLYAELTDEVVLGNTPSDDTTVTLPETVTWTIVTNGFNADLIKAAEGYVKIDNGDGTITIQKAVAKIGDTYFATLAAAIQAAQPGDTITLLTDVTEDVTVNKSITIDGAGFKYTGNIAVKGSTVAATIKNVNFVNGTGYAITTNTIKSITVEDCTVTNYAYGFLYANKTTTTVVVKNVTVDGGNYGFHWVYGTTATLENVTVTNAKYGLYIQNYAGKTINLKNCDISSIAIWERSGYSGVQTFKFEGENKVGALSASQYAKYVLVNADATLTAPEGYDVTTTVAGSTVKYVDGTYKVVKAVAQNATTGEIFGSIQDAINAAQDGDKIVVLVDIDLTNTELQVLDGSYDTYFLVEGKSITIDLNEKVISGEYIGSGSMLVGVFSTDKNGKLTLTGNGTVDVTATGKVYTLITAFNDGSSVVIENGTYKLDKASDSLIYYGGKTDAEVVVKGGTFELGNVGTGENGKPWIFNVLGAGDHHVFITGGTFNADVNRQHWANEAVVAETCYMVKNDDGTWTVKDGAVAYVATGMLTGPYFFRKNVGYATIEEAFAAAVEYDDVNITLLQNVTLTKDVEISIPGIVLNANGFTLDCNGHEIKLTAIDATLAAPEGYTVTTDLDHYKVVYEDGVYKVALKGVVVLKTEGSDELKYFDTIAAAMAEARNTDATDTVYLIADHEESVVLIYDGTTLDLQSYTLKAEYLVSFNGGYITGNIRKKSNTDYAKLIVPKQFVVLSENAVALGEGYILPVWDDNEDAFVFAQLGIKENVSGVRESSTIEGKHELYVNFGINGSSYIKQLLLDQDLSGIHVEIVASWNPVENGVASTDVNTQVYRYSDESVYKILVEGQGSTAKVIVEGHENLTMYVRIVSDTGVLFATTPISPAD